MNEKGVGAGVAGAGVIRIVGRITTMKVENSRTSSVAVAPSRVTWLCATHLPYGWALRISSWSPSRTSEASNGRVTRTGSANPWPCGVIVKTFETGRKPSLGGSTGAPAELFAMAMVTVDCAFRAPAGTTTRAPVFSGHRAARRVDEGHARRGGCLRVAGPAAAAAGRQECQ